MNGKIRITSRQQPLTRTAVLLLALADLAERAAGAPYVVRLIVLWALQQADTVVKEFVAGCEDDPTGRCWSPAVMTIRYGNGPADAMNLALSLRILALAVECIAAQTAMRLPPSWNEASDEGCGHRRLRHLGAVFAAATHAAAPMKAPRLDTS